MVVNVLECVEYAGHISKQRRISGTGARQNRHACQPRARTYFIRRCLQSITSSASSQSWPPLQGRHHPARGSVVAYADNAAEPVKTCDVVVVGAGIAGLVAARKIHRAGVSALYIVLVSFETVQ